MNDQIMLAIHNERPHKCCRHQMEEMSAPNERHQKFPTRNEGQNNVARSNTSPHPALATALRAKMGDFKIICPSSRKRCLRGRIRRIYCQRVPTGAAMGLSRVPKCLFPISIPINQQGFDE